MTINSTESDRLLRLKDIVGPSGLLPISKSSWWKGIREGRYPAGIKIAPRTTAWRKSSVLALIKNLENGEI
jgi:prophage regulatory protein